MQMLTRNETAAFLSQNDSFSILTHRRPDGDTIGSAALLCRGLRSLGKRAHILENPEITEKYTHLHKGLTKSAPEAEDLLICVDVASPQMLSGAFSHLRLREGWKDCHRRRYLRHAQAWLHGQC